MVGAVMAIVVVLVAVIERIGGFEAQQPLSKGLEWGFIFDHVARNIDLICSPGVVASLPQWWRPADS